MELTYETYVDLGGTCSELQFPRLKADAEADLARVSAIYTVVWNTAEAHLIALVSLIDNAAVSLQAMQTGGGATQIRVGSYSETRRAGGSGAFGNDERVFEIVSRYARLFRRGVGVRV